MFEKLQEAVFSIQSLLIVTYLPSIGGGTNALRLTSVPPTLEQLFEHCRLASLAHHLHTGAGWILLGFDKALRGDKDSRKVLYK